MQSAPLSIGRLIEVTFTEEGKTLKVPVSIRLTATVVESSVLAHILSAGSRDFTLGERFHRWRAGELRLLSDLILGADIIDEERKVLAKDKSGAMSEIIRRRRNATTGTVLTGDVNIGSASNLLVASKQTLDEVERRTGQKISNPQFRERLFATTYVMQIVIVDTEREMVVFYTRGQSVASQYAVRELKAANKGSGPDISEIIKAFQLGNSVSL